MSEHDPIHHQLAWLEEAAGLVLADRTAQPVEPTVADEQLLGATLK